MTVAGKPDLLAVLRHYDIDVTDGRFEQLVRCPVHSEDRPSCSVNSLKGTFNCHACPAQGDSYKLIQLKEGVDFVGAVKFAQEKLGYKPGPSSGGRRGLSGAPRANPTRGGYRPSFRRGLND